MRINRRRSIYGVRIRNYLREHNSHRVFVSMNKSINVEKNSNVFWVKIIKKINLIGIIFEN